MGNLNPHQFGSEDGHEYWADISKPFDARHTGIPSLDIDNIRNAMGNSDMNRRIREPMEMLRDDPTHFEVIGGSVN